MDTGRMSVPQESGNNGLIVVCPKCNWYNKVSLNQGDVNCAKCHKLIIAINAESSEAAKRRAQRLQELFE